MNKFCSNECDYHQQVIDSMDRFPEELKSHNGLNTFVWGHEVEMHDAGRGGGDGSADLLTVDEEGGVWLIEAKFGYNPELSRRVWDQQLARYQKAVRAMSWQRLLHYCEAFLKGREGTKPNAAVPPEAASFTQVLQAWQRQIGRALVQPDSLNDRMASALQSGTYGIMVLANSNVAEVVDSGKRFQHGGPVAYVRGDPTESGIVFEVLWWRPAVGTVAPQKGAVNPDPRFDAWKKEVNGRCDPESFADSLCEGSRDLWLNVLRPGLLRLGWSGRAQTKDIKQRAFNVAFDVNGRSTPLLVVGWPEADSKAVTRDNKRRGQACMKVNPRMKCLLETSGSIDFVNRWAQRFYRIGWRGRPKGGMRERWGTVPITEAELRSAEGVMLYHPDSLTRDHTGRTGDRESLEGLLREFAVMLDELRRM